MSRYHVKRNLEHLLPLCLCPEVRIAAANRLVALWDSDDRGLGPHFGGFETPRRQLLLLLRDFLFLRVEAHLVALRNDIVADHCCCSSGNACEGAHSRAARREENDLSSGNSGVGARCEGEGGDDATFDRSYALAAKAQRDALVSPGRQSGDRSGGMTQEEGGPTCRSVESVGGDCYVGGGGGGGGIPRRLCAVCALCARMTLYDSVSAVPRASANLVVTGVAGEPP
eukprot:GHVU01192437.1.p1 GENE.GHVU01192437.1~~GHVU01192437.1.p1  ORF type:complete len:227 (-),score=25.17 GHVU01192437.1:700-1380(-)